MRIISGKFKGKPFYPNKKFNARPTTDFAKEGLFNILNNTIDFTDLEILDLFSGTGSISYEFLSRNSKTVHAVEKDRNHIRFINKTINELKVENFKIFISDVFRFVKHAPKLYDIIFADPPFDLENLETIPDLIFANKILKPDGFLILEHSNKNNFDNHKNFYDKRNYGKVNFSFFKNI